MLMFIIFPILLIRKYISSVEPVIVSQSCALVKSYLSGLQQSHTEKVSGDPSKENVDDDT